MKKEVLNKFLNSSIVFTKEELDSIDYADFGLDNFSKEGLSLIIYENNDDYCAKEMVLLKNQTCPEHKHPPIEGKTGKKETFRCRKGDVYLYIEGDETDNIHAIIPNENKDYYTVFKEIHLSPGDQYTIEPNTLHWFQAGKDGAVISEFSTKSVDEKDIFTNPNISR